MDEIWPVTKDASLNEMLVRGRESSEDDVFDKIENSIDVRRMNGASEETILSRGSPVANMFFSGDLDRDRLQIETHEEDGFGFTFELDDDYREELREKGVKDEILAENSSTDGSSSEEKSGEIQ